MKWKNIPGYEGSYQISNTGEVRSLSRHVQHNKSFRKISGRTLKPRLTKRFSYVSLYCKGKARTVSIEELLKFVWKV